MGTSDKNPEVRGLVGRTSGMIWGENSGSDGPALAVSGDQLVGQALYGNGYRAPQIDERLLRYHPGEAAALGDLMINQGGAEPFVMAGEVIKG